jgi:hypothetical protein
MTACDASRAAAASCSPLAKSEPLAGALLISVLIVALAAKREERVRGALGLAVLRSCVPCTNLSEVAYAHVPRRPSSCCSVSFE